MSEARSKESHRSFVLHANSYKETSLLIDIFGRSSGRLTLVARGARRPRSALRGILLAFQPISLSWIGKGEVRTLAQAEWIGGQPMLKGEALLCGFYLNELLLRLLPREDSHEKLFDSYEIALASLARSGASSPVLREFEKSLLAELGYAMTLDRSVATGSPIAPEGLYSYEPERGPLEAHVNSVLAVHGQTLIDVANCRYDSARTQAEAKMLMRHLINHRLENRQLTSRRIYRQLLDL